MLGMTQILKVRRAGFRPKAVFWLDDEQAISQWQAEQSSRAACLRKGYTSSESFELASDGKEAVGRMDLRALVGVDFLNIQTSAGVERAKALHDAAKRAGAKLVATVNFENGGINFTAINGFEQVVV